MDSLSNDRIQLLELSIFRAIDNPQESVRFAAGQQKRIAQLGISDLSSLDNNWIENPHVFVMALKSGEEIIGGSRLHISHDDYLFPLEQIPLHDFRLPDHINELLNSASCAESCGLWLSDKFAGYGLGEFIVRVVITTAHCLGVESVYAICSRHNLDTVRQFGYTFSSNQDKGLRIPYPKGYESFLMKCNSGSLEFAFFEEQKTIKSWLTNPIQSTFSKGLLGEVSVKLNGFPEKHPFTIRNKDVLSIQIKAPKTSSTPQLNRLTEEDHLPPPM